MSKFQKNKYKESIETKFKNNNSKGTWKGIETKVWCFKIKPSVLLPSGEENAVVNFLNQFYAWSDCFDLKDNYSSIC